MNWGAFILSFVGIALLADSGRASEYSAEQLDFFEKKIRPVLADKCYGCHSAEGEKLKAHLQVDHREHLLVGGDTGPSIVPGKPEESLLIEVISYETPDLQMPPKGPLDAKAVEDFRKWIADGAAWPDESVPQRAGGKKKKDFDLQERFDTHWSWRPVEKTQPPSVDGAATAIDKFIRDKVNNAGLRAANPADKRTLVRRAYFDLIGLPPTPEQIRDFLEDDSEQAWESLVDELLASPHFGEKWARHWMDLVRYAETYGHEFDYPIDYAYEYRDYLIRAFNADIPYNQFVTEHIAGDLLENPRRHPVEKYNESILGTGFWYFHEATHAPTDVMQDEADHMDNQLDVFGKSFLGLTVACARCHDHKFDAISTADYYALTAYLHSSCRQEVPMDPGRVRETTAAKLKDLQKQGEVELALISPEAVEKNSPGKYFKAAAELMRWSIKQTGTKGNPWDGIVFDDFESGNYAKWKVAGKAFGKKPATGNFGPQKLTGDFGKGLVNSFFNSDKHRGSLTSAPFTIGKPYLNFYIAGGKDKRLSFEIHVDGKVYLSTRGLNNDVLKPAAWNLSAVVGKEAFLKIVDEATGGWGHIVVDRIVFSDVPATDPNSLPVPPNAQIAAMAKERNLDPKLLTAWAKVFVSESKDVRKPEALFAALVKDGAVPSGVQAIEKRTGEQMMEFRKITRKILDFDEDWSTSGEAFVPPVDKPTVSFYAGQPLATPGVFSSSQLGGKQNGTLRSPTFTIENDVIHVLARSKNLFARVVMDNYHMAKFSGLLFGGTIEKNVNSDGDFAWFSFKGNLNKYKGHKAFLEFVDKGGAKVEIAEIRSGVSNPAVGLHPVVAAAAGESAKSVNDVAANLDSTWRQAWSSVREGKTDFAATEYLNWLASHQLFDLGKLSPKLNEVLAQGIDLQKSLPAERYAVAMAEGTPEQAQVYIRGSYRKLGETVPMRNLTALGSTEGSRLDLAASIVTPQNPLASRVMVNRLWHHLFGRGIVASVDDFGPMGQLPSHPELLDWLAAEFVENGWSVKQMIRQIVLSDTYQQDSAPHPELEGGKIASADPENILLHRMPVRRLPAEAIRDAILTVSGRLDKKMYGPSVPTHRTEFMTGRGGRGSGPLDGNGRRSIYGAVYRNFLSPFMLTFDQPSPFGPKGRRSVSNVPAQSLALMNDPFVVDQARLWARNTEARKFESPEARIRDMYEAAFGVVPGSVEVSVLNGFLREQSDLYGKPGDEPWVDLAHAFFNMKDFIYLK